MSAVAPAPELSKSPADAGRAAAGLWRRLSDLIDQAPSLTDLKEHKLQLLAVAKWRAAGGEIAAELAWEERLAGVTNLVLPTLLSKVRAAYSGRIVLFKGPEAARRYPDPTLRPYADLDVLVDEPEAAHAALLAAGFVEIGDPALYVGIHHLRPVALPALPIPIEVHRGPKWVDGLEPPAIEDVLADVVESQYEGVWALPAAQHAVLLAVHSWAHEPLRRLLDLVDIAAIAAEAEPHEVNAIAREWGVERIWKTTERAIDAVFYDGPTPLVLRIWARNVLGVRGRTVLESHLENWLAPLSALPPRAGLSACARSVAAEFRPAYGEPWSSKLSRTRFALRHVLARRAAHHEVLRREGLPMSPRDLPQPRGTPEALDGENG